MLTGGVIGQTSYSSSKNSTIAINRCMALENSSKNINCNVIPPDYIKSYIIDNMRENIQEKIKKSILDRRFGKSQDIFNVVNILLSHDNYFQGVNIDTNGGLFIR